MKTAISIPNDVFRMAEEFARRRRLSRSALYAKALSKYVGHQRSKDITAQLDRVYAREDSALDPVLWRIQVVSLPPEKW